MSEEKPVGLTPFWTCADGHMWRASARRTDAAGALADVEPPLCPGCGGAARLVWLREELTEDSGSRT
jgi:hypothetical protein